MILRDTLDALAAVIFPAPCRLCGVTLVNSSLIPICEECIAQIQPIKDPKCVSCGLPFVSAVSAQAAEPKCQSCQLGRYKFERARSFGVYNDALGGAIVLLKYEAVTRLAGWFASRLERIVRDEYADCEFDAAVPVPLYPARQRERGYNQAEVIAKPLARALHLKLGSFLLVRTKPRPAQRLLTHRQRWLTVRGAYETRKGSKVDKLRILLVDDVFTTGATLDSCSRALMKAGASSVCAVTVARVVPGLADQEPNRSPDASNVT